ncbi:NUDIX hydrolase [Aliiroseovarius subalbicans]|uniref:NUDIX hydrolase n=1 Tax=Aliiroseovarius subalbicans TaxID=2925840 RepID=UPI001F576492|nr:NUDIX hydrolase [Aliiroseovarius subalbicans]MCI2400386.1 NUDIX hydrolase [Aliiroseovarius subalbicans]
MSTLLKQAWSEVVRPLIKRPNRFQVAALCYRGKGDRKEVLLVTSRGTGRWILPKGWPIDGMNAAEAAMQDAWKEAGVTDGKLAKEPLGEFQFTKQMNEGAPARCSAQVYPIKVKAMEDDFPEAEERELKWVATEEAAEMVDEKDLQQLLRDF